MCRLFGFRSFIPSRVHASLLAADNALGAQSNAHPDGWGVAYYVDGSPHVTKSTTQALGDQLFHRLSGLVSSETVLAHVRKATQGGNTVLNCHPFQFGRWVFAHNGDVPGFAEGVGSRLREAICPRLRPFVFGDTDSETIFFIFLSALQQRGGRRELGDVIAAVQSTLETVRELCHGYVPEPALLLTFIVTDGDVMVATQGGKELLFSTYKRRCPERDRCPGLAAACEAPSPDGRVSHLIVSSERLQGSNVWEELAPGEILGVDRQMRVVRTGQARAPLAAQGAAASGGVSIPGP